MTIFKRIEIYKWADGDRRMLEETLAEVEVPPSGIIPQVGDTVLKEGAGAWPTRWRVIEREFIWTNDGSFANVMLMVRELPQHEYEFRSFLESQRTTHRDDD